MKSYLAKSIKLLTGFIICAVLVSCGEPESADNVYPSQTEAKTSNEQTHTSDISSADTSEALFKYMPFSAESGYASEEKDTYPIGQNGEKTIDDDIILTPMNK